jgi:hypothetical protein
MRTGSRGRRLALAGALACLAACSSPNRGEWSGTFAGSVSGNVEFKINSRGTTLTGKMEGTTSDGAPFHADMEGKISERYFYATFEGRTDTGLRPIPFEGFMKGELGDGKGAGDWDAKIRFTETPMNGTWTVTQIKR